MSQILLISLIRGVVIYLYKAKDQPVSRVLLWEGLGPGRKGNFKTFPKILMEDLLFKLNVGEALVGEHVKELALNRKF